ncbi:MAG: amidase [Pseudolabrys sp.]|jgi:Asp-tRNA(Asn)/Glu-tRNA(Gln) amidotransferase A subunit family amidase
MADETTTLADTIAALRDGVVTAEQVAESCLARIDEVDGDVQAWTYLDPEHVRTQARALDAARADGKPMGPLHGIPVGIKDIFDTDDMPTEDGTVLHAGRRPWHDATAVALLREAGAVIMGKTVTTEMALFGPGKTHNPHDSTRTPGGSSSGSAAAVASGMVPLAIGSQTNGSTIRPASFCGVVGYKPSHGLISRNGVLTLSRTLDHVGVFAGSVADAALIAEIMMRYDAKDTDMRPKAAPELSRWVAEEPPLPPKVAFLKTPVWDQAEEDTREAFEELVELLGEDRVEEVDLSTLFEEAVAQHKIIQDAEVAVNFGGDYERGRDRMSPQLIDIIEHGLKVTAAEYIRAVARIPLFLEAIEEMFERYDAILTPSAPGEAPAGTATGNPIFCTVWTLLGMPAVSLPLLSGNNGLPIGVQLVGQRGNDGRLLRTARWLTQLVEAEV